jgi:hypothetical protein
MKDKFATLGINSFTDLEEACNDVDVLEALQTSLPIMAFSKFRKAVQKSSRLDSSKMMMFTTVSRTETTETMSDIYRGNNYDQWFEFARYILY